jgi:flagellar export protein FliJ
VKAFRFTLQRVLDWRETQLRAAEEKLSQLQNQLASLHRREHDLLTAYQAAERKLIGAEALAGADLQALAAFRGHTRRRQQDLQAQRKQCEAFIAEHRQILLKIRRDHRVLEKLKEKRWRTWVYLNDREVEETAAEAYLAKWARPDAEGHPGGRA